MTFEIALKFILTMFGSLGFWEFLKHLITSRRRKKTAEQEALLSISQYLLYPKLEEIYFRGRVGYDEMEMVTALYKAYQRLGGNGTTERRYRQVDALPRIKDEEIEKGA